MKIYFAENNNLVFLLHGWESNPGAFQKLLTVYLKIIIGSLLLIYLDIFLIYMVGSVIKHINPKTPFNIVAHSFGQSF